MFGYHDYKALHLVGLIFFLMSLVRAHSSAPNRKFFRPLLFSSAFLTFSTGMILMVRWGLLNEVPPWIWGKFAVMAALFLMIWFPRNDTKAAKGRPYILGLLIIIGVICSVYKPL